MAQTQEQVGRALVVLSVLLAVLVVVWLYRWEQGARTPEVVSPSPGSEAGTLTTPELGAGQDAFQRLCASCHPGGGAGLGPSLLGLDRDTFIRVTREGKGAMPAYTTARLSNQELETMYAYLKGLSGAATPTPAAQAGPPGQQAFQNLCNTCHPGGGAGLGPSLLGMDRDTFTRVTREGKGAMPAYTTARLSNQELEAMYAYLQGLSPAPAPAPPPAATPAPPPTGTPTPSPVTTPTTTPVPTTPAPAPTATPTPTPAPTPTGPPAIPHSLEGRSQCLACHASGNPAIPQVPANHAGRTNEMCTLCHSPRG